MVVQRKTPVAPVPAGSRTNSTAQVPRATKPKTSSTLANSTTNGTEISTGKDATNSALKSTTTSPKSHPKVKHKHKHHKKPAKARKLLPASCRDMQSRSWWDTLLYVFFFSFVYYAFTNCPYDEELSNPICRSLSQYRTHVLEPYVLPPLEHALSHPSVAPYVEAATRIERTTLRPITLTAVRYAIHAKRVGWDRIIVPSFRKHVVPQWRTHAQPHLDPYLARAAPHILQAQLAAQKYATLVHRAYSDSVQPRILQAYVVVKPHAIKAYEVARPHLLKGFEHGLAAGAAIAAQAGQARRTYVDPHVIRMWDKVLELSGQEPAPPATVTPKKVLTSTAATTESATVYSEATPEEVVVTTTESAEPTAAAVTAEEDIPVVTPSSTAAEEPTATEVVSSSSSALSAAAQVTEEAVPASVAEEISAASVVIASAHGMESALVEEIADAIAASESEADLPAEVVHEGSPVEAAAAEPEAVVVAEEEEDPELLSFLDDIGLVEEPEAPITETDEAYYSPEELAEIEARMEAEQAAIKARKAIEDRADVESRMARSTERLTKMAQEKGKDLRKMLVSMRKKGVAEIDDVRTRVGGALKGLEAEGEKLLKGLESYLKKEHKSKSQDYASRAGKWQAVTAKVENKLQDKVTETHTVIGQFHADEKNDEGMSIIQEVKDACSQAQGDVGLDLSWLPDVTWMDWQVYHDLARIGEKFQAEASEIQGGTHSHPPIDPLLKRVELLNEELVVLVNGFSARLEGMKKDAELLFTPPPEEEDTPLAETPMEQTPAEESSVPDDTSVRETAAAEADPAVSILPIEPEEKKTVNVDSAEIFIGKSSEQVEEAMRNYVAAVEHEEL
ncbi:unnamed protein product [Mycena citricolor]|uniref:Uncharacterized protein n=1 Tax=Mycena citricolor TaxID=2018698 RepID=A0AAD2HF17_9AGAR|nr:unnamed protein product [Mycena citricolor]